MTLALTGRACGEVASVFLKEKPCLLGRNPVRRRGRRVGASPEPCPSSARYRCGERDQGDGQVLSFVTSFQGRPLVYRFQITTTRNQRVSALASLPSTPGADSVRTVIRDTPGRRPLEDSAQSSVDAVGCSGIHAGFIAGRQGQRDEGCDSGSIGSAAGFSACSMLSQERGLLRSSTKRAVAPVGALPRRLAPPATVYRGSRSASSPGRSAEAARRYPGSRAHGLARALRSAAPALSPRCLWSASASAARARCAAPAHRPRAPGSRLPACRTRRTSPLWSSRGGGTRCPPQPSSARAS